MPSATNGKRCLIYGAASSFNISVYQLVIARFKVVPEKTCFLSSNGWDAFSAKAFGFRVLWCSRFGQVPERIPTVPDGEIADLSSLPQLFDICKN